MGRGQDLGEALDHLLDPLAIVPLRSREGTRAKPAGRPEAPGLRARRRARSRAQPSRPEHEACQISFWRGYVKSQFLAVTERDGKAFAVAASPYFRTRGAIPPEDEPRALGALAVLREELSQRGWELTGHGERWFEGTFARPLAQ